MPSAVPSPTIIELADEVAKIADEVRSAHDQTVLIDALARAIPLARRLDADAVRPLEHAVDAAINDALDDKRRVAIVGLLQGVAQAARIEGPAIGATSPSLTINQHAASVSAASAAVEFNAEISVMLNRLEALAESAPPDVQEEIARLAAEVRKGDRKSAVDRALTLIPLVVSIPELVETLTSLLGLIT